jgi:ribosomal protein S15P/S13E
VKLDTQLIIAKKIVYIKDDIEHFRKLEKIKSKILGLIKYLRNKDAR